ncbi:MAG: hypothetical protein AMXMBFR16_11330 [Candidatus Uhrbacteria bacterium]
MSEFKPTMKRITITLDERIIQAANRESGLRKMVGQNISVGEIVFARICQSIAKGESEFTLRFKSNDPDYRGEV